MTTLPRKGFCDRAPEQFPKFDSTYILKPTFEYVLLLTAALSI